MAFPASPSDGQIYQNYRYDDTIGAWQKFDGVQPVGSIVPFSGDSEPSGWLPCDGRAISRTEYSELNSLYSAAGYPWGNGDGSTTFNIPDLRGVFPRGAGTHGSMTKADGTAFDGGSTGDETNDQMQQITGLFSIPRYTTGNSFIGTSGGFHDWGSGSKPSLRYGGNEPADYVEFEASRSTAAGGARTGNETRPASVTVSYIVKF